MGTIRESRRGAQITCKFPNQAPAQITTYTLAYMEFYYTKHPNTPDSPPSSRGVLSLHMPEVPRHIAVWRLSVSGWIAVPAIRNSLLFPDIHHLGALIVRCLWQWQTQEFDPGGSRRHIAFEQSEVPLLSVRQQVGVLTDDLDHPEWASVW